jgi:SsrA-binding protein
MKQRAPAGHGSGPRLQAKKIIAENKPARFHYTILENVEAGLALQGTEVKSLRKNRTSLAEAHAGPSGTEIFLFNLHIPEYSHGNRFNHEPRRPRRLLLHRRQIHKLLGSVQKKGLTLIPLSLYFNERGRLKIDLGLARGKKLHDKRESEKKRDWDRSAARLMRRSMSE